VEDITALSDVLFPVLFKLFLKSIDPYSGSQIPFSHPFVAPMIFSETECTKPHSVCKSEAHVGFIQQDNNVVCFLWTSFLIITHIPFAFLTMLSCELMFSERCTQCLTNPQILFVNGK